jgi:hypothetical protein
MQFTHALVLIALCCAAAFAQAPQPVVPLSAVEDVYLARDDGEGKAGEVTETFTPSDIPIQCVIVLSNGRPRSVKMMLVAVKVPGVKPESRVVAAAYTTKDEQDRVYFTGRPEGKWVPGTYRIDVFVDEKKERSVMFEVKGTVSPAAANKFVAPVKKRPVRRN